MINKFFYKKRQQNVLNDRIVWGIWVPKKLKLAYKVMASSLRVPISVLVTHILVQWIVKNGAALSNNAASRQKYGDYLTQKYIVGNKSSQFC